MTPNYSAVLDFDYQLRRHGLLPSNNYSQSPTKQLNKSGSTWGVRSIKIFSQVLTALLPADPCRYGSVIGPCLRTNIFHFSEFFLDKIDFNLDKIDFNLDFFFHFSEFFLDKIDFNLDKIEASKRITRCDSLTSTYDHSRNIVLFLIKLTIHQI